jgi:membrane associated rhomboid family serine protease
MGSPMGSSLATSVIGKLILANVIVFIIQNVFPTFTALFALTPRLVVENFMFWQMGTYMFLHGGFMHLLFNMLMLWLFGSMIESLWGGKQFLRYYIVCGIGGAAFSLIFNYNSHIVGASGAIFGLYLAYAMMFPNNYVYVYFVFPVKAKYLVMGMVVFQLANGIAGPAGIAYFAHLGGMAGGLLFFRKEIMQRLHFAGPRRKWRSSVDNERQQEPEPSSDGDNIDSILDKISSKGYENLSSLERRILENYSRKKRKKPE